MGLGSLKAASLEAALSGGSARVPAAATGPADGGAWGRAVEVADKTRIALAARTNSSALASRTHGGRKEDGGGGNLAAAFAKGLFATCEAARMDARLLTDYQSILDGHCKYMPHLLAGALDFSFCERLASDLERNASAAADGSSAGCGMVEWSRHLKHENPTFSSTFQEAVSRMAAYFDVEVFATRLNFYRDGADWKPFHHDSHAYGHGGVKEDLALGFSVRPAAAQRYPGIHVGNSQCDTCTGSVCCHAPLAPLL